MSCSDWKNHETWSINLFIYNERAWRRLPFQWLDDDNFPSSDYYTEEERRKFGLAAKLKDWAEETFRDSTDNIYQQQLIGAALRSVDWIVLAEHYIANWIIEKSCEEADP